MHFPGDSDSKGSACTVGDPGSVPGLGRSLGGRNGYPFQYSCLGTAMDRRVWQDCSPWGRKVLAITEWLILSLFDFFILSLTKYVVSFCIFIPGWKYWKTLKQLKNTSYSCSFFICPAIVKWPWARLRQALDFFVVCLGNKWTAS